MRQVLNVSGRLTSCQAVTKRAGRKKESANAQAVGAGGRNAGPVKAVYEGVKKEEAGVSDLTLLSKISNESINENLKKRFENAEIYVREGSSMQMSGKPC